jgi:hypothetical protein
MMLIPRYAIPVLAIVALWSWGCDSSNADPQSVPDSCVGASCDEADLSASPSADATPVAATDLLAPADGVAPGADTAPPQDLLVDEDIPVATPELPPVTSDIIIPIAALSTEAKFFEFDAHTVTVKYFAVLDDAGEVHIAFDACDVCYGAKKGYRQEGSMGTENKGGGCWPGYLEAAITETEVVVDPDVLTAGTWYFE